MNGIYKKWFSPLYHAVGKSLFGSSFACRFTPTCSEYSKKAYEVHGYFFGTILTVGRLLRCNPFFAGGFDPVPDKIN